MSNKTEDAHRAFVAAKANAEAAGVGATDDHRLRHAVDSARELFWKASRPAGGSQSKHDPQVYVRMAKRGLNNNEIADVLGDVSESAVRRGLKKAGHVRT